MVGQEDTSVLSVASYRVESRVEIFLYVNALGEESGPNQQKGWKSKLEMKQLNKSKKKINLKFPA